MSDAVRRADLSDECKEDHDSLVRRIATYVMKQTSMVSQSENAGVFMYEFRRPDVGMAVCQTLIDEFLMDCRPAKSWDDPPFAARLAYQHAQLVRTRISAWAERTSTPIG
jgi:hypothetical protein